MPDQVAGDDHPAVVELRDLSLWSQGQVWCSPERHGQMTGVMKAQIDHLPLAMKGMRPTQGRTLAVMHGLCRIAVVQHDQCAASARTLDADGHNPQPVQCRQGV
jgi:NAD(P)H-dependent FMN reductase